MAIITIFDGASQLGIAVAKALSRHFEVRLATSKPEDVGSLQSERVTILKVDPSNVNSLYDAMKGSYGCFITTNTDFTCSTPFRKELQEGKNLANACEQARIRHVVFCTQLSVVKTTGLTAQHMDAKADIEAYMLHLGLPLTCVILPIFYEDFLVPPLRPIKSGPDSFEYAIPTGPLLLDVMGMEDMGEVVNSIFSLGNEMLFKTTVLTGDKLAVRDIASIMSKYLAPKRFRDKQVTIEQFTKRNHPGVHDMAAMFDFLVRMDQRASAEATQRLNPGIRSFPQWVHQNASSIHKALDFPTTPEKDIWA